MNLPNYEVFSALSDYLQGRSLLYKNGLRRWKDSSHVGYRLFAFDEEFFIVLAKLKTCRTNQDLAYSFGVSTGYTSELITTWLYFLSLPHLKH